jgi:hypothetical protein
MTYSAGGLIEASDYNGFAGGNGGGANVSGQLNTVLGTGYGNAGYGQTPVANVSVSGQVTAAQWTTLVNGVNTVRKHQSGGSFTNLSLYTAGTVINATNDVSSNLTTAYTNRFDQGAGGPSVNQPSQNWVLTAPNDTSAQTFYVSRTATFGSSDQARYFFNAGGNVTLVVGAITNTGGTSRGASLGNVIAQVNGKGMTATAMSQLATPAPFIETTDLTTNYGYYGQTSSNTRVARIDGSSYGAAYSSQYATVDTKVTGTAGSNGGKGEVITMSMEAFAPAQSPAIGDSINITVAHYLEVHYPDTTYLANTWGSVTFG